MGPSLLPSGWSLLAILFILQICAASSPCYFLGSCNGHGDCDATTYTCICYEGWGASTDIAIFKAPDCSQRTCPSDMAWVDIPTSSTVAHALAECSNQGSCDRVTGECLCYPGFEGDACQRSSCPNSCSGHGKCVSIKQMATEPNGMPVGPDNLVYGGFETSTTWDESKIYGCVCDSSWSVGLGNGDTQVAEWFGPDCSLRHCPSNNDPMTTADETNCKYYLNNGATYVGPGGGGGVAGNLCQVDCSNRGLCDYNSGLCLCFDGYYGQDCSLQSALAQDQT